VEKAQLLLGVISPKEPATIGMIPKLAVGHMIKKTAAPQRLATEMTLARLRSLCTIFFCFSNLRIDSRAASQLSFMAFWTTCQESRRHKAQIGVMMHIRSMRLSVYFLYYACVREVRIRIFDAFPNQNLLCRLVIATPKLLAIFPPATRFTWLLLLALQSGALENTGECWLHSLVLLFSSTHLPVTWVYPDTKFKLHSKMNVMFWGLKVWCRP